MSPAIRLAAHKLRAGWRGWAALALLTAIAGGTVLAAAPMIRKGFGVVKG